MGRGNFAHVVRRRGVIGDDVGTSSNGIDSHVSACVRRVRAGPSEHDGGGEDDAVPAEVVPFPSTWDAPDQSIFQMSQRAGNLMEVRFVVASCAYPGFQLPQATFGEWCCCVA